MNRKLTTEVAVATTSAYNYSEMPMMPVPQRAILNRLMSQCLFTKKRIMDLREALGNGLSLQITYTDQQGRQRNINHVRVDVNVEDALKRELSDAQYQHATLVDEINKIIGIN